MKAKFLPDCGILFSAFDDLKYYHESVVAAVSYRRHMPDLPIALITNLEVPGEGFDIIKQLEPQQRNVPEGIRRGLGEKVRALLHTPFRKTLFVDGDTHCCHPIYDMLGALEFCDFAACHSPNRDDIAVGPEELFSGGVWINIPAMNTGVVAYNNNKAVENLLEIWENLFYERFEGMGVPYGNQSVFREALALTGIKTICFPVEYNLRMTKFAHVFGSVRILHGRPKGGSEPFERAFNSYLGEHLTLGRRGVFYAKGSECFFREFNHPEIERRMQSAGFAKIMKNNSTPVEDKID